MLYVSYDHILVMQAIAINGHGCDFLHCKFFIEKHLFLIPCNLLVIQLIYYAIKFVNVCIQKHLQFQCLCFCGMQYCNTMLLIIIKSSYRFYTSGASVPNGNYVHSRQNHDFPTNLVSGGFVNLEPGWGSDFLSITNLEVLRTGVQESHQNLMY